MIRKYLAGVCIAAMLAGSPALSSSGAVSPADIPLPQIDGPIPQTDRSHAYNSAAHSLVPQDLSSQGFVEEEYLFTATGRIYDLPPDGILRELGSGPYTTRIIVRRPTDPAKFNGAVVIEPLNSSAMADADLMWMFARDHFLQKGYAWIGITHKPVSGEALRRFDPVRYRTISFANPLPAEARCPDLEIGPDAKDTEVGFQFDMLGQLGALVRSDSLDNPLNGYAVSRVYMTGFSQTAGIARAYAVSVAPFLTRDGGKPIYDGYVMGGHGPFSNLFNNCDEVYFGGDPRLVVTPVGVPFIDVAVEGDVPVSRFLRRPDSDRAPDLYRHYEVAGGTHSGEIFDKWGPRADDLKRAGVESGPLKGCFPDATPPSQFPLNHAFNAIWQNLDEWVKSGTPPPRAKPLKFTKTTDGSYALADHMVPVRDKVGNAVGGVRSVAVEVPTARWVGARDGAPLCLRAGYGEPLDAAALKKLYPSREDYLQKVEASVGELIRGRWLTPEDGALIIEEARHAPL